MGRIFAAAAVVAVLIGIPVPPLLAQTETTFIQGDETYPAHILPERFAVVLSQQAVQDPERNKALFEALEAQPLAGLGRNVLAVPAPELRAAPELGHRARETAAARPDDVVETGLLVTIGESDLPFVLTNRIIVQLADHAAAETIRSIAADFEADIVSDDPFKVREFVISVAKAEDALGISNAINGYPEVLFAHPDFYRSVEIRQSAVTPNDTFFADQWHLHNTGQGNGTPDADIDADLAWSFGLGNPDVLIAIIDMGFLLDHPDMVGSVWTNPGEIPGNGADDGDPLTYVDDVHGWDFTCQNFFLCGDADVTAPPDEKHGVAVAGAALARGNNGLGIVGSCPGCSFLPIRAIKEGEATSVSALASAIRYATAMGADLISNSWSFPVNSVGTANVAQAAQEAATTGRDGLGAIVLFAMSNDANDDCAGPTPQIAHLPEVVAVSRATHRDAFSPGGYGDCMDVLAPSTGTTLLGVTTDHVGADGFNNSDLINCNEPAEPPLSNLDYTFCYGGSSFATPVVAGVAGLILSQDDTLTRAEVQSLLKDTADKVSDSLGAYSPETGFSDPPVGTATHGYGRVNAFEAVRIVADAAAGGRGGVDIFIRDNRLDWGNTEQPSNVTFEPTRGFIPHWQSVDIKVDAPPFEPAPPATSVAFDVFAHENPRSGVLNRVYVRVHNRGPAAASDVMVKLHWAFAGAGLPALPADFWAAFPADAGDVSVWHPLPAQTVASLPYSGASVSGGAADTAVVLSFDFNAPSFDLSLPNPGHYCLFAVIDADSDPISTLASGSLVPDFITPRDNNVTHRNVTLLDSGNLRRFNPRLVLSNPFDEPIGTRLVVNAPKGWKATAGGAESERPIELAPGKSLPVELMLQAPDLFALATVDVVQVYRRPGVTADEVLGGMTYEVAPHKPPDRVAPTADMLKLLEEQQALVGRYGQLVAEALAGDPPSEASMALIEQLGRVVESQDRLLQAVTGGVAVERNGN